MDRSHESSFEDRPRRDPRPWARTAVLALVVALMTLPLVAAACGGGGTSSTSGPSSSTVSLPAAGGAVQVTMKSIAFTPADVTVKVGQTVTWINDDAVQHDVVANDGAFKSDLLSQGQTFSFTFTKVGTFAYYCAVHPQMKGTVTVQP